MALGDVFTDAQQHEIARVIAEAERVSGWDYSVHVGAADGDSRVYAESLHASLPDPARSVLVQLDQQRRSLEIVTGSAVARVFDNRAAGLVAVTMQSAFTVGDLAGGLVNGLQQMAQLARAPRSLHTDTP